MPGLRIFWPLHCPWRRARPLAAIGVCAFASVGSASAQSQTPPPLPLAQYHHQSWSELEGLKPAVRERLLRSPDGYLWLSGPDALVRFDGVRFTSFDGATTPELASPVSGSVSPLLVARDGAMWISRPDGALVQYRDGRFREVVKARGAGWSATYIAEDRSGNIWVMVSAPHGLHTVSGDSLVPANTPPELRRADMGGVIADRGDGVWFGMRDLRLAYLSSRGVKVFSPPSTVGIARVTPLLQSSDGAVWVFGDGLQVLRDGTWTTVWRPDGSRILPTSAAEDASGAVWVGTRGHGVLRFRGALQEQFSEAHALSDAMVRAILPDVEGNRWLLTDAGLDRLREAPFSSVGTAQGMPIESPHWLGLDSFGALWMRTYLEPALYVVSGGAVRGESGLVTSTVLPGSASRRYVIHTRAREGGFWVSTEGASLWRATLGGVFPAGRGGGQAATAPYAVLEDGAGALWVTDRRLGLTRRFRATETHFTPAGNIAAMPPRVLFEDDVGRVVVSTPSDTSLLYLRGDSLLRRIGRANGLRWPLQHAVSDGNDTLWGHAGDGGLIRVIGSSVTRIDHPELSALLKSNSIAMLAVGERFFIASTSGITSVPRAALHRAADGRGPLPTLRRYSSPDGVRSGRLTTMNRSPAVVSSDGRVWFSTPGGLVVFDERYDVPNRIAPHVHIEELLANGERLALDSLVRVPAGSAPLEIRFTATALRMPERARLEFRMDGVDPQWRTADATRRVTYPQLRPRTYTFRVRAWNEDGVAAGKEAFVRLRVLPLWFQSSWFLVSAAIAGLVAIVFVVAFTLRDKQRRAAERLAARFEATLTERTRVAGELHDTLLQGFTGITLQLQALRSRMVSAPDQAERELGRVLTVADHTLREARSMVWDMRAPELDGQDVAAALENATREAHAAHRLGGGAPVELQVTIRGARRRVSPTSETTALRIGREAVTNALRHARATRIDVQIDFDAESLRVSVVDNGMGFDVAESQPAAGVGHWGLIGMQERARRASGSVSVTSSVGAGTSVDVRLPVS